MNGKLYTLEEVKALITEGKKLLIAAEETLLDQLPSGNWIAGTIPYFMGDEGGVLTKEKLFVNALSDSIPEVKIELYDDSTISNVYADGYENGYSVIIIPATSSTHLKFALNAPKFEKFATLPLIGWISGVDLADLGKISPKIFNGTDGSKSQNGAIVMHVKLEDNKAADIGMVNIFTQGEGDKIQFLEDGFSAQKILVNNLETDFVAYIQEKGIDTKLPLVANYEGAMINVSFQAVNVEENRVDLYAPVFRGLTYKIAAPVGDYVSDFGTQLSQIDSTDISFSCNCILNYLYGELEGKKTAEIVGPITFGEIAYQLVNQTLAYINIFDL